MECRGNTSVVPSENRGSAAMLSRSWIFRSSRGGKTNTAPAGPPSLVCISPALCVRIQCMSSCASCMSTSSGSAWI